MSPNEAKKKKNEKMLREMQLERLKKGVDAKFEQGNIVRITTLPSIYARGYKRGWSKELFFVTAIDQRYAPTMYQLHDFTGEKIDGKFYRQEMQLINPPIMPLFPLIELKGKKATWADGTTNIISSENFINILNNHL